MKSNVKVSYIEATTLEDIQKETNRELEVLQTNVKTTITNISMSKTSSEKGDTYTVQIVYTESDEPVILNEVIS
jgi:hypothetical protein